jgi:hypothetical protein
VHQCADGSGSPRGFYLYYDFTDTGRGMWATPLALDLATRSHRYSAQFTQAMSGHAAGGEVVDRCRP